MSAGFDKLTTGKLSIVATPIGNLEDITLRALRILKESDVVACEDTRVTKKLLSHYDIHVPTVSFHANSGAKGFDKILKLLEDGKNVALVSDAGTPGVSDPGLELVSVVREQLSDVKVETIPGASSLTAALAVAGLRVPSFTFYGFLPQKKGRETLFKEIGASDRASIFLESPHRILKCLGSLTNVAPDRRVGLFRELTKMFEDHLIGTPQELLDILQKDTNKQRGEFVVIVEAE
ncbi:MAG TPA: 16S rRNA (cytidine(1402)-2'-O)-methyltransferase [Candidatus Paceibacterota bacterium]|jgi:16S rRNA (cytidine1402-2'-O)-methyltransferase|nr:16S rRNA (cytidine(1402)-2'-O)-methyltransferase [Candidatus Paceibacterota bacterium]